MKKECLSVTALFLACITAYAGNGHAKKKLYQPKQCNWTILNADTAVVGQYFTYDKKGRLASDSFAVLSGKWILYDTTCRYVYKGDSVSYILSGRENLLVVNRQNLPLICLDGFGLLQNVYYDTNGAFTKMNSTWVNDSLLATLYDSVVYSNGNLVSCRVTNVMVPAYTQTFTYYDSLLYRSKFNSHTLHKPLADDALEAQLFSKNLIKSVAVPKSKYENYVHNYRYWFDKRGRVIKVERQTAFDGQVTSTSIIEYVYAAD